MSNSSHLKVDGASIAGSASRIQKAGHDAGSQAGSTLKAAEKLASTGAHKVFASLVDGVFDELRANLPNDIEALVQSYADGLLEISNAAGATDHALSRSAELSVGTSRGLQGGEAGIQAAGGASLLTGGTVVQTWSEGSAQATSGSLPQDATELYGTGTAGAAAALKSYVANAGLHPSSAKAYVGGYGEGVADRWGAQSYNCTSWAEFRRSELGLSTPSGEGYQMAGNAGAVPASQASLGSLVSLPPTATNSAGHVMVVEKVLGTDPPSFLVSQMNYNNQGAISTDSTLTYVDGKWMLNNPEAGTDKQVGTPTFSSGI